MDRATGYEPVGGEFESLRGCQVWDSSSAVEQLAFNQLVEGSNPSCPTNLFRISSAVEQLTVNQLVGGSIPPSGANLLAYSNLGECTRLLTETEVGSNPTTPANLCLVSD